MIKREGNKKLYYDKYGTQIVDGCNIKYPDGSIRKVYLTVNGDLGTDATNPQWIESGRAIPCEYGIYPLSVTETNEVEVVNVDFDKHL